MEQTIIINHLGCEFKININVSSYNIQELRATSLGYMVTYHHCHHLFIDLNKDHKDSFFKFKTKYNEISIHENNLEWIKLPIGESWEINNKIIHGDHKEQFNINICVTRKIKSYQGELLGKFYQKYMIAKMNLSPNIERNIDLDKMILKIITDYEGASLESWIVHTPVEELQLILDLLETIINESKM